MWLSLGELCAIINVSYEVAKKKKTPMHAVRDSDSNDKEVQESTGFLTLLQ